MKIIDANEVAPETRTKVEETVGGSHQTVLGYIDLERDGILLVHTSIPGRGCGVAAFTGTGEPLFRHRDGHPGENVLDLASDMFHQKGNGDTGPTEQDMAADLFAMLFRAQLKGLLD